MTGTNGIAPRWLEALCLGMGLPLLVAVLLADLGGLPSRSSDAVRGVAGHAPLAGDPAPDAAARPSQQSLPRIPVTINLAGWRMYVQGTAPDFPSMGLARPAEPLARAARAAPNSWPVAPAPSLPAPGSYLPQAPPVQA